MPPFYQFMLITNKNSTNINTYLEFVKKCADGGITSLQLREKMLTKSEILHLGELLLKILEPYKIPLIINDSSELAKKLNSPYIHLGQKDDSIQKAFKILPQAHIGISIEHIDHLHYANKTPNLSYVTASAVFTTSSKDNISKLWGLEGIQELSQISKHPVTAIGGITLENTPSILQNGAQGIALIGAIHNAINPYQTCKSFRNILDMHLN